METEIEQIRRELAEARQDVVKASGELLIDVPTPGTDLARVMIASTHIRKERDSLRQQLEEANKYVLAYNCFKDAYHASPVDFAHDKKMECDSLRAQIETLRKALEWCRDNNANDFMGTGDGRNEARDQKEWDDKINNALNSTQTK